MRCNLRSLGAVLIMTTQLSACLVDLDFDGKDQEDPVVTVRGSGVVVTVVRDVSAFTGLAVSGSGQVITVPSDRPFVEISADDNVLRYIETAVRNGVLQVKLRSDVDYEDLSNIVYRVGVQELDLISLSGAVAGELPDIDTPYLSVALSGVSTLQATGWALEQHVVLSGVTVYRAAELETAVAEITASGVSAATVWVRGQLVVTASGVASIEYLGTPTLSVSVTGAASVRAR